MAARRWHSAAEMPELHHAGSQMFESDWLWLVIESQPDRVYLGYRAVYLATREWRWPSGTEIIDDVLWWMPVGKRPAPPNGT